MNEKTNSLLSTLGDRLKQARLNANLTQLEVAQLIGKSRTAVEGAEKGKCTLDTFVNILVALRLDDQLALFLPDTPPSPVQLAKAIGKKRKRASSVKRKPATIINSTDDLGW